MACDGVRTERFRGAASAGGAASRGPSPARRGTPGVDAGCPSSTRPAGTPALPGRTRFAVFGDYGKAGSNEEKVANLVAGWKPDFIVTLGDNNYPLGEATTIDANIGQYFHDFIAPYTGHYGCGASENRFFPSLGNHDWYTIGATPYLDYFSLPGNERYYDVTFGDVHLFALDSDPSEPDGVSVDSIQASWLKDRLAASTAKWKVVYMHHPPYSSGPHLSNDYMQWPYRQWGANVVFAGHDHDYERLTIGGTPYIVAGLGGADIYTVGPLLPESEAHFDSDFGAVLVEATSTSFTAQFFTHDSRLIDKVVLNVAP
jgi:tartrate-resistant acid phosphatase type 5